MQIILLQRIGKLGKLGDEVRVRDGYARNYLLPRNLALQANSENRTLFQEQKQRLEQLEEKRRVAAMKGGEKIAHIGSITFIRSASDAGNLYGSISSKDIAKNLSEQDVIVQHNRILLPRPIKYIGVYKIDIDTHTGTPTPLLINVARNEDEASNALQKYLDDNAPDTDENIIQTTVTESETEITPQTNNITPDNNTVTSEVSEKKASKKV